MIISLDSFQGMKPRVAEHLLEANMASLAQNCNLLKGSLRPWKNKLLDTTLAQTSLIKTIHYYLSAYWLEWSATVNLQSGPIAGDTTSRFYYTGDGVPKKSNVTEATTGSPPYPVNFYPMGAPTPAHAIVAALGGGGSGEARTIGYVWTIVTSWGEEGPPADVSNLVSALQGQTVNLSGITIDWQASYPYERGMWVRPTTPNGYVYRCSSTGTQASGPVEPAPWGTTVDGDTADGSVTWTCYKTDILTGSGATKRIYRINSGDTFGQYTFVGAVAMGTSVFVDNDTDTQIAGSAILPSSGWYEPPQGLTGLATIGRFMAGFVGKDLYFCEPNYPHAWPEYGFPLDFPIIGLGAIGNTLVAGTEQNAYVIQGTHPSIMTPVKLPESHPCVAARAIVAFPEGVAFPSSDGLYFVAGGTGKTVTKGSYSTEDWKKLYPATWHATRHDGRYFAFYDDGGSNKGGVIIDLSGQVTTLDFVATAVYVDPKTDTLYFNLGE